MRHFQLFLYLLCGLTITISHAKPDENTFSTKLLSIIDKASPYQKNGHIEIYGGSLQIEKAGAISVKHYTIYPEANQVLLVWFPQKMSDIDATDLELGFDIHKVNNVLVGWQFKKGDTYVLLDKIPSRDLKLPSAINRMMQGTRISTHFKDHSIELPSVIRTALLKQDNPITSWFVLLETTEPLEVSHISLTKKDKAHTHSNIEGNIIGFKPNNPTEIELLTEEQQVFKSTIMADSHFKFKEIPVNQLVSVRYRLNHQYYYANLGRWFENTTSRQNISIDLEPEYINQGKSTVKKNDNQYTLCKNNCDDFANFYLPHTQVTWSGMPGRIKEYENQTFVNNIGYVDRDRFFEKQKGCYRILQIGTSFSVSLQVQLTDKYTILLEDLLGLKLNQCVEVISAGRDTGDLGANYERTLKLTEKFKPDLVLLEVSSMTLTQMHPKLSEYQFGWDHDHSVLPNFYYKDGEMHYRQAYPKYQLYTKKPKKEDLVPGVPIPRIHYLPFTYSPPEVIDSWRYLGDALEIYKKALGITPIVLYTIRDEALCHEANQCEQNIIIQGDTVKTSYGVFLEHLKDLCGNHQLACIFPSVPGFLNTPNALLTFEHDQHLSKRGHQWLANELAKQLFPIIQQQIERKSL